MMARLGDVCEVINGFAFKSEQYVDTILALKSHFGNRTRNFVQSEMIS